VSELLEHVPEAQRDERLWGERIQQAREDRRQYEPAWVTNLAFAAGKHWLQWNARARKLEMPNQLRDRDLYVADVITEYRTTALGEMAKVGDRPELLLVADDDTNEEFQEQANRSVGWAWDNEWRAELALSQARRYCIDLGVAAIRPMFRADEGPVMGEMPVGPDGHVITDLERARAFVAETQASGQRVQFKTIHEGRHRWEPLSPFNLLVPPGIDHEEYFPWEIVMRPVPVDDLIAEYGLPAGSLQEDPDIASLIGLDVSTAGADARLTAGTGGSNASKLRNHAWLYKAYERPCPKYPDGRCVHLIGDRKKLVRVNNQLPYTRPDGTRTAGINYFHWVRLSGRFFSRSLVDGLKDPQRIINRRRTQGNEIIDRGMPKVFVEEGAVKQNPSGVPVEKVELKRGTPPPSFHAGIGPGEWMYRDIAETREDIEHASGFKGVRLGENPANVNTYSQLALLSENDQTKREDIYGEHQRSISRLMECSIHDMRAYWPDNKQLALAGDENRIEAWTFTASRIPDFFIVRVPEGAAKPRSQAAELKKVEDLWAAALNSGSVATNPLAWVDWYRRSLDSGEALEMPAWPGDVHEEKAELENHRLLSGEPLPAMPYDPPEVHVLKHREAQIQAEIIGDTHAWQLLEQHVQEHLAVAAENARHAAATQPAAPAGQVSEATPAAS